jgi:hypothetical protein
MKAIVRLVRHAEAPTHLVYLISCCAGAHSIYQYSAGVLAVVTIVVSVVGE